MRPLFVLVCLTALPAGAKPWFGIEAGSSHREEVIKKFGEPSRSVTTDGREQLAYLQKTAIKGTTQAQFKIDPATQVVERIDVFPAPFIDRETVEGSYGPLCAAGPPAATPCYVKRVTDDFQTYFFYAKLGLAVFFSEDGKRVQSLTFQPEKQK